MTQEELEKEIKWVAATHDWSQGDMWDDVEPIILKYVRETVEDLFTQTNKN